MSFYVRMDAELRRRGRVRAEYARFIDRRLDRRRLMARAWSIAASQALRFGDPAWTWIGPSLGQAWRERRDHLAGLA